eukprot:31244-Pelagococcus_subviridis.AAC.3
MRVALAPFASRARLIKLSRYYRTSSRPSLASPPSVVSHVDDSFEFSGVASTNRHSPVSATSRYRDRSASVFAPPLFFFPLALYATSYVTNFSCSPAPSATSRIRSDLNVTDDIVRFASRNSRSRPASGTSAVASTRRKSPLSGCVESTTYCGMFLTYALNRARTIALGSPPPFSCSAPQHETYGDDEPHGHDDDDDDDDDASALAPSTPSSMIVPSIPLLPRATTID